MALIEDNRTAIRNCGRPQQTAPLCEPTIITSTFLTGGVAEVTETCVRIVGWEQVVSIAGEMEERRIVTRLVMSTEVAREIVANLRNALAKGGH